MHRLSPGIFIIGLQVMSLCTAADREIDFNLDVRPILADKCYACHGPDDEHREGGLRLDIKTSAFGEADSGERAIVPRDLEASELYVRLTEEDEDMRMPPADSNKALKVNEIALIRRWIEQGAQWGEHWAFVPLTRPSVPVVKNKSWPRNPIDSFILARLEREGLAPSVEADKETIIRRLSFDLTGLPPTFEEIDAFLTDESPEALERVVDRLLKSPRYGEHMARFWLDAARYGDTHGLHMDNYREMWPYRDWVVTAFNDNMPFSQFTIEQLAGDLLPDPTRDQIIATGFNRCHVTTSEGGSIKEEVYVRNVVDRVLTTGTVFLGMTFDCTRCHDHKYDPFTMNDFYSLFAFFNSLDGNPLDRNVQAPEPVVRLSTPRQDEEVAALKQQLAEMQSRIKKELDAFRYEDPRTAAKTIHVETSETVCFDDKVTARLAITAGDWEFVIAPEPVFSGERSATRTATGPSEFYFRDARPGWSVAEDDMLFAHVYLDAQNPPRQIMVQWYDVSGGAHPAYWGDNLIQRDEDGRLSRMRIGDLPPTGEWVRLEVAAAQVGLTGGATLNGMSFWQFDGTTYWDKAGIVSINERSAYESLLVWESDQRATTKSTLPAKIQKIIQLESSQWSDAQREDLLRHFVEYVYSDARSIFDPLHKTADKLKNRRDEIETSIPTTLVFRELKEPRPSYFLNRGEYDQRRHQRPRATPATLPEMPPGAPMNRLGFAQWLVDPGHPLTTRVAINRFWQQFFGVGIVKTAEDFGSQGDPPSHPQLLDWLAIQFIEDGWDLKSTLKRIVMSATYRQSAQVSPELAQRDPENRLLARGPRFRLDAEMLRDQALAVSGLLVEQIGGPSVKPPQPDGLWFAVSLSGSNTVRFEKDNGPDKVHRRSLYTFIKRTAPPPQMSTLDGPSRESSCVRRERTNTPLQALLMLNDPQYFETARALAERTLREATEGSAPRAAFMYRLCTAQRPDHSRVAELVNVYDDLLSIYQRDVEAAKQLVAVGESKPNPQFEDSKLAAWTMVANLILNLDEVVNKN